MGPGAFGGTDFTMPNTPPSCVGQTWCFLQTWGPVRGFAGTHGEEGCRPLGFGEHEM